MRHGDDAATVHYAGVTGHVGILPQDRDVPEPPTAYSTWFVPDGWPAWTGTWVEPDELSGVEGNDAGSDRAIHAGVSAE